MQTGAGTIQETRTYALTYTLRFQLEDKKGKLIYGPASLSSSTTEFVYSGQVLGNNQELPPAYQRLRKETIQKMLLKLSANDVQQALDSLHENQPRPTP